MVPLIVLRKVIKLLRNSRFLQNALVVLKKLSDFLRNPVCVLRISEGLLRNSFEPFKKSVVFSLETLRRS